MDRCPFCYELTRRGHTSARACLAALDRACAREAKLKEAAAAAEKESQNA
jgi:hypothetical protein